MYSRLRALMREMFVNPRGAVRAVLTMPVSRNHLIEAAILVSALAVLVSLVPTLIFPPSPDDPFAVLISSPLLLGVIQFVLLILVSIAVFFVGRAFGGTGSFHESMLALIWLNFAVLAIEAVTLPLYLVAVSLASMVNVLTMILAVWWSVNTVAELHGFRSLMKVFGGMIGASFVLFFVILMIAGIFLPDV